jgi:hypothetical protein
MIHRTLLLSVLSVLVALAPAGWAAEAAPSVKFPKGIPNHPEKLQFPPLQYEPPDPKDYRLQLAAGPVAYIATDRELPRERSRAARKIWKSAWPFWPPT